MKENRHRDRLVALIDILRDGQLHRAEDLAQRFDVSVRTIYRDMDKLIASGVPVAGTRGEGYRVTPAITLPPLSLTPAELEALNLGLAVAAEVGDRDLQGAAETLAAKFDAVLPAETIAEGAAWQQALQTRGKATRVFAHLPVLRAAIQARQKLRIGVVGEVAKVVRPLKVENWGRFWLLMGWSEDAGFTTYPLDQIESAEALPELFVDEDGKTLADYRP
ncbi:helix-turn-helix transcriptional regulator [Sulfitobacter delicatus]|uniref:helix-turn-helix transcriptional regulator n=1 Tax=Sulfitobacter delicatus TaxID=218672 RepID=UPI000B887B0A|nr:HTH domain-containing protein [Sulfitobacter delicatus]